ncbi:hypothetical protein AVEN_379-1 [Araneus ventricosus]|uniref:Uncharacterized protein n=1 Tax=Araneus ventricosus TaxID=182803 RepID=A0A4Y2DS57_ARAVE|nr:hypothetical protein AVEN_379-1 [Araneus ventricosus]
MHKQFCLIRLMLHFEATRTLFWNAPPNFEPWSIDQDGTRGSTFSLSSITHQHVESALGRYRRRTFPNIGSQPRKLPISNQNATGCRDLVVRSQLRAGGFKVRNLIPHKIRLVWRLLDVKSCEMAKRTQAGVVWKFRERDDRCRLRHLTAVHNY